MKKRVIALMISSLLTTLLLSNFLLFNNRFLFLRKFGFSLPKDALIINSEYSLFYDCLELEVKLSKDDFNSLLKQFEVYSNKYMRNASRFDLLFCKWFNDDSEEIIVAYHAFESSILRKTRNVVVLLTHDFDCNYYLHVYY